MNNVHAHTGLRCKGFCSQNRRRATLASRSPPRKRASLTGGARRSGDSPPSDPTLLGRFARATVPARASRRALPPDREHAKFALSAGPCGYTSESLTRALWGGTAAALLALSTPRGASD